MRERDADDQKNLDTIHEKVGMAVVQQIINSMITAGGSFGDLLQLLEAVDAAVFIYILNNIGEEPVIEELSEVFKFNVISRIKSGMDQAKVANENVEQG